MRPVSLKWYTISLIECYKNLRLRSIPLDPRFTINDIIFHTMVDRRVIRSARLFKFFDAIFKDVK